MDTIYALSSGQVPCGVAVVRVSGQAVSSIISQSGLGELVPRKLILKSFLDQRGNLIDRGMVAYFPGPASFTGEDCLEFHVHGGRAVVMALYAYLDSFPGVRAAEPGEFTKTAFVNGKMDLTAAEGLADIIHAETAAQLSLANDEASGRLFDLYKGWMDTLLEQESLVTACIDFADEDDVSDLMSATVSPALSNLRDAIATHLARKSVSRQIREGYRIAIIGEPNVGKSSLLNKLAGSERAIVSDIPGTTRDVVEVRLDINGRLVILADTAGMRDSDDILEMEGIRRSRLTAANSDLVIVVSDGGSFLPLVAERSTAPTISVQSKSDLGSDGDVLVDADIRISSKTGEGVDELLEMISEHMNASMVTERDFLPIQERHIAYLHRAVAELESTSNPSLPLEMVAEHVRSSAMMIGKIVGRYDVEDVLGAIFSRFCIGK